MKKGLWKSNFEAPNIKTPKEIIQEQAILLSDLTNGAVIARISEINDNGSRLVIEKHMQGMIGSDRQLGEVKGAIIQYEFFLTSKAFANYKYRAFIMEHGIEIYPASFRIDSDICAEYKLDKKENCVNDETELMLLLEKILNSSKMTKVVNSLMALK